MDAVAGARTIVTALLGFSSSTVLTPTASLTAKTAGMHSWMSLLEPGCFTDICFRWIYPFTHVDPVGIFSYS